MSAWQFPSTEFGEPLKLQPQPGSQLQNSRYVPESAQSAMPLLLGLVCGEPPPPSRPFQARSRDPVPAERATHPCCDDGAWERCDRVPGHGRGRGSGTWPGTRSRRHDRTRSVGAPDLVDLETDPPAFQRVGVRPRKARQRRLRGLQPFECVEERDADALARLPIHQRQKGLRLRQQLRMPARPLVEPPDQLVDLARVVILEKRDARIHFSSSVSVRCIRVALRIYQAVSWYRRPLAASLRRRGIASNKGEEDVKNAQWRSRAGLLWLLAALGLVFAVTPVLAGSTTSNGKSSERVLKDAGEGTFDVLEQANQYGEARTAPADTVDAGAFSGAYLAPQNLPLFPGTWNLITNQPYNSDAQGYRDPVWSNSGGGAGN